MVYEIRNWCLDLSKLVIFNKRARQLDQGTRAKSGTEAGRFSGEVGFVGLFTIRDQSCLAVRWKIMKFLYNELRERQWMQDRALKSFSNCAK